MFSVEDGGYGFCERITDLDATNGLPVGLSDFRARSRGGARLHQKAIRKRHSRGEH